MPGELLVRFRGGVDRGEARGALEAEGAEVEERLPLPRLRLVELPRGAGVREAAAELEQRPQVRYAEPNFIRTPSAIPNDTRFAEQWGLHNTAQFAGSVADADIDAPEAWNVTTGAAAVTVAVVDDGLAYDHPDLDENVWRNPGESGGGRETNGIDDDANGYVDDWRGWDFAGNDADPYPTDAHGTHVAGIIGAEGNNGAGTSGVSWDVSLMALRVFGDEGLATSADVVAAFTYAAKKGARVVNASFGGGDPSQAELDAILAAPGTLFSVAAGNDAQSNDIVGFYPCNYPAPNLVCVAATDEDDILASFSNYGPINVDLAAPGRAILSSVVETVKVLEEDFQPPLTWETGGVNNAWGLTDTQGSRTPYSLTDSPSGDYQSSTDSWARSPALDLSGLKGCRLFYELKLDLESIRDPDPDYLAVEVSSDGGATWEGLVAWTGSTLLSWKSLANDLGAASGDSSVRIRFRLVSDGLITRDGAYIDDPLLTCVKQPTSTTHSYFSGTSMAAPMVSGAAALLLARFPGESVTQVRDRLLGSVDQKPGLAGKVATGGRLNVARALGATPDEPGTSGGEPPQDEDPGTPPDEDPGTPPVDDLPRADDDPPATRITSGPSRRTRDRTPTFRFRSDDPDASFECRVDRARWRDCDSPQTLGRRWLARHALGPHKLRVRAFDEAGNRDRTPAKRRFSIVRRRR